MPELFPEIAGPSFAAFRERLNLLGAHPPQVLLLDGGSEAQRLAAARWWACRCNCPHVDADGPCLDCDVCRQIAAQEHLDVPAFDGRISNKKDEDEPGPVRALSMENVRALKSRLKDPPHGTGLRVVLITGLERQRTGAANALLKVLEEPSDTNCFVLMAAQRAQLLPALVSRSRSLVLPWPAPAAEHWTGEDGILAADLEDFLKTGRRLFPRTGSKSFDASETGRALDMVQKAVLRCMAGRPSERGLDRLLDQLPPDRLAAVSRWIMEARGLVQDQVAAGRVLESFMCRIFVLMPGGR